MEGPLKGLRVIDAGTRISAPFCAGLLGELGAEVIKVELPGEGDFMRTIGPFAPVPDDNGDGRSADAGTSGPAGYSLFWAVEGRGRKGVTCNLRTPEGQQLFKALAEVSDVICENFRPGTMESWNLGPGDLDPSIVYVRISVFGQTGPYSKRPGLDRMGIGYGGLLNLTGYPDRPPVRPGVTVSDYLTGVFAAEAAIAALYARDAGPPDRSGGDANTTRMGAVIDAPLYGAVLRILEWTIAGYDNLGLVRGREGNRLPNSAPLDNYPTADGRFVCIVAGSDANFSRLCKAMGQLELLQDPRFLSLADRARHGDEINAQVAEWTSQLKASEVEELCVRYDVPVATAYSAREIDADPHMAERGDIVSVEDPVLGAVRQQAPFPRFDGQLPVPPSGAPKLGQDNQGVWCDLLGLTPAELQDLSRRGIV